MNMSFLTESKNDINTFSKLIKDYKNDFKSLFMSDDIESFYLKIKSSHLAIDTFINKYKYLSENKINEETKYIKSELNSIYIKEVSSIFQDENYYEKFKNLKCYDNEDEFLKTIFLKKFEENGVNLNKDSKNKLNELNIKLMSLQNTFSSNISYFKKENIYIVPDNIYQSLNDKSKSLFKEKDGEHYVSFDSHLLNVLSQCDSKQVRCDLYKVQNNFVESNNLIIKDIIDIKKDIAHTLGFETVGELVFSKDTYMSNGNEALAFIDNLRGFIKKPLKEEYKALTNFAKFNGEKIENINDIPESIEYYKNKYNQEKLKYPRNEEKKYLNFDNVLQNVFHLVKDIYNIEINLKENVEDIILCDIFDNGVKKGNLILDVFERNNKEAGARCFVIEKGSKNKEGTYYISANLPVDKKMSFLDVKTLLHETGHLTHHVSTKTKYPDYSGTVLLSRDTVEIPSMMLEKFFMNKSFLCKASDNKIPNSLIDRYKKSTSFNFASFLARQTSISKMDLKLFNEKENYDPNKLYSKVSNEIGVFIPEKNTFNNAFVHIYTSTYNSGYYGYLFSDVVATNLYNKINKNKKISIDFKDQVLSRGSMSGFRKYFDKFNKDKPNVKNFIKSNIVKEDNNNLNY